VQQSTCNSCCDLIVIIADAGGTADVVGVNEIGEYPNECAGGGAEFITSCFTVLISLHATN